MLGADRRVAGELDLCTRWVSLAEVLALSLVLPLWTGVIERLPGGSDEVVKVARPPASSGLCP